MGGNALKAFGVTRVSNDRYVILKEEIEYKLLKYLPNTVKFRVPASYLAKESHGDIDIIISGWDPVFIELLKRIFNTDAICLNGPYFSIKYKEVQVDFIVVDDSDFKSAYYYLSYNDLGNLLGTIFHSNGFKYGHKGLLFEVMDGTLKKGVIHVSKDPVEILGSLGLSYDTYKNGFVSLKDIFDFIISSPMFSPEIFQLDNLISDNRHRTVYIQFLEYIKDLPKRIPGYSLFSKFPELPGLVEDVRQEYDLDRARRQKINGFLVRGLTGLDGPDLGLLLRYLRMNIDPEIQEVEPEILRLWSRFKIQMEMDVCSVNTEK
jgi:hypothetical protein